MIHFGGRLGPIVEAMKFQPNISNPLTLIINGGRNHLYGKIEGVGGNLIVVLWPPQGRSDEKHGKSYSK